MTVKAKAYRNAFDNLLRAFDTAAETSQTLGRAFNSYYADQAYGGSGQADAKLGRAGVLAVSLQFREDRHLEWQQSFPGGSTEPRQTSVEDTWSLAVEQRAALRPDLTLTASVSYDWRDLKRAEDYASNAFVYYRRKGSSALNGQARLSWSPAPGQELYAFVSDRSRFPTLFDRFSSRFGGAVSNPDLKPERAVNYEIGGSRTFRAARLESAAFYSDLSDSLVNAPFLYNSCTPQGVCSLSAATQSRNLGHGRIYGAEASVSIALSPALSLGGNYTLIRRDLTDPTNAALRPTDVPDDKGLLYAAWTPTRGLTLSPSLEFASNRWTVNTAGTTYARAGAYAALGVTAEYAVSGRVLLQAGARNLTDRNYALADGYPEPGRRIFLAIRARY